MNKFIFIGLLFLAVLTPAFSHAETEFQLNGFGTFGATHVNHLYVPNSGGLSHGNYDEKLSMQANTKFALQGKAIFTPEFSTTIQVLTRAADDYEPELEWAYASYKLSQNFSLRAGRVRRPSFKHSDHFDLGYAYPWVSPPAINYYRSSILYSPITALDVYHTKSYGNWVISQQWYVGADTSTIEDNVQGEPITYKERAPHGVAFDLTCDDLSFRLAYQRTQFDVNAPVLNELQDNLNLLGFPEFADSMNLNSSNTEFYSLGAQLLHNDWTLNGELSLVTHESPLFPEIQASYVSLDKRFGQYSVFGGFGHQKARYIDQLQDSINGRATELLQSSNPQEQSLGGALSQIGDGIEDLFSGSQSTRRSVFLGTRIDIRSSMALKLQYENLHDRDIDSSADIFSISLDFIF